MGESVGDAWSMNSERNNNDDSTGQQKTKPEIYVDADGVVKYSVRKDRAEAQAARASDNGWYGSLEDKLAKGQKTGLSLNDIENAEAKKDAEKMRSETRSDDVTDLSDAGPAPYQWH